MTRSIAVGLLILAVSTSAALAAHRTHHAKAAAAPQIVSPGSSDAAVHAKGHRESGYHGKNDYGAYGTMRVHHEAPVVSSSGAALHAKGHRESGYHGKSDYNANGTMKVHH
jgi:hypothetical protein